MGWVEGLGLSSIAFHHGRRHLPHHGPVLGRSGTGARVGNFSHASLRDAAAHVSRASLRRRFMFSPSRCRRSKCPRSSACRTRFSLSRRFIFYKIQPLEELPNYGVAGAVSTVLDHLGAVAELELFRCPALFSSLRGRHRQGLSAALDRAGTEGLDSRLVVSRLLFCRRQVAAVSSADLGGAVAILSAAVVGGAQSGIAAIIFTACRGSLLLQGALEYADLDACRADAHVVALRGDFLDRAALRSALAAAFRRRWRSCPMPCLILSWRSQRMFATLFLLHNVFSLYGSSDHPRFLFTP